MQEITKALASFTDAQAVMEWLKENGLLKEGVKVGDLAFDYAIRYESPHVIDAFRQVAKVSIEQRAKSEKEKKTARNAKVSAAAEQAYMDEKLVNEVIASEARTYSNILTDEIRPNIT